MSTYCTSAAQSHSGKWLPYMFCGLALLRLFFSGRCRDLHRLVTTLVRFIEIMLVIGEVKIMQVVLIPREPLLS